MPAKKAANPQVTRLREQVAKLQKENKALKTDLKDQKEALAKHLDDALEEIYSVGYIDALEDMDAKGNAMEAYMDKAMAEFEKDYAKKLKTKKAPAKKAAAKKSTTKKTTKKTSARKKK